MKLFISKVFIVSVLLLPQVACTQTSPKLAPKNGGTAQGKAGTKNGAKATDAKSIEVYDLLVKLIPDEGKTAAVSNLETVSDIVKWRAPEKQLGVAEAYNYANIIGETNVTCDGTVGATKDLDGYYSTVEAKLDKAEKLYYEFTIYQSINPKNKSFEAYDNYGKQNQKLLSRLLGKRDFSATYLPGLNNISVVYELNIPGKNKAWIGLSNKGSDPGDAFIFITVMFKKEDLKNML